MIMKMCALFLFQSLIAHFRFDVILKNETYIGNIL
jgi:hypothetical protein